MHLRPALTSDSDRIIDIDGVIQSDAYLHVDATAEGVTGHWRLEERPRRQHAVARNALSDEILFSFKQIASGILDGIALVAEHDGINVACAVAVLREDRKTMELLDLRVDSDYRLQGLGSALMFQMIQNSRGRELRAVTAIGNTGNLPGCRFLQRTGFELCGLDTRFVSNHDLVKDAVTLFWYAPLD